MYLSYSIVQPYYLYVEFLKYNVVPAVVTLTFDSSPSSSPFDYIAIAKQGQLSAAYQFGFSTIDSTFNVSGNSVSLTMPITVDSNAYVDIYYQGVLLPVTFRANQDYRYTQPAIWMGLTP